MCDTPVCHSLTLGFLLPQSCRKVIYMVRKGRESQRKPPLKKGVPTFEGEEFDSRISAAAIVPHEEKVLWATKNMPYGTPLEPCISLLGKLIRLLSDALTKHSKGTSYALPPCPPPHILNAGSHNPRGHVQMTSAKI